MIRYNPTKTFHVEQIDTIYYRLDATTNKVSIRRFRPGSGYRSLPLRVAGQRFDASDLTGKFGMVDIRAVKALKGQSRSLPSGLIRA